MHHQRKADIAHGFRHCRADVVPACRRVGRAGRCRNDSADRAGPGCHPQSARNADRGRTPVSGSGRKSALTPLFSGRHCAAGIVDLEHAAARHADVHMRGVARVDQDRVQLRAVRRAVLVAAAPRLAVGMLVESRHAFPRRAAVRRAEQSLRRRARIPDARLARVSRREPERVIDDAAAALGECGRPRGFLPGASVVGRAEDRRPEVAGARCGEQRLAVARIDDRVVNDVAEKLRPGQLPRRCARCRRSASTVLCASRSADASCAAAPGALRLSIEPSRPPAMIDGRNADAPARRA